MECMPGRGTLLYFYHPLIVLVYIPNPITTFLGGPAIPDTLIWSPSARLNANLCFEFLT